MNEALVSRKKKYTVVYRRKYQLSGCLYCAFRCGSGVRPPCWVTCDGEKHYFKEIEDGHENTVSGDPDNA